MYRQQALIFSILVQKNLMNILNRSMAISQVLFSLQSQTQKIPRLFHVLLYFRMKFSETM